MHVRLIPIVLALAACSPETPSAESPAAPEGGVRITGDDMLIEGDVRIAPGTYAVTDNDGDGVLHVRGAGTRLDLTGVTLVGLGPDALPDPDTFRGIGISVTDAPGSVVTGGTVQGFKIGLRVAGSDGAVVEKIDVSRNFRQRLRSDLAREDLADWLRPHDNDEGEWETKYGAGISVSDSRGVTVRRCRARDGQNGLLLTRADGAQVYDNDFSFLSGWGVALYRTSGATVCRNRLDWCVRGYSHGVYDRGQDSAGILLFEQCSENTIALNSATHGGDGLFLYAGEETLKQTGHGGSNRNVVVQNDFSHAVANAIEATFSVGNVFAENILDDSRHGVWAGYSHDTRILGNTIRRSDHGISIEHGVRNQIEENVIEDCGNGVHLWWDADPGLLDSAFGRERETRSRENRIGPFNVFRRNRRDVWLRDDQDGRVVDNAFENDAPRVRLEGSCARLLLEANSSPVARLVIEAHHTGRVRATGTGNLLDAPTIEGPGRVLVEHRPPAGMLHRSHAPDVTPLVDLDALPGEQDPFLAEGARRGRDAILVDEWGPVDPSETRLFPAARHGSGEVTFSLLGDGRPFRVAGVEGDVVVEPSEGTLPALLRVRPADGAAVGIRRFEFAVEADGTVHRASGSLFSAVWQVEYRRWETDPREDETAWRRLLETPPLAREELSSLDLRWNGAAPHPDLPPDGFATVATTSFEIPAGVYRLETVSDDGIRVWLDDELVIDDWTHHAPTEHGVSRTLAAGRHTLRVEHFELDGWAVLAVRLARD